MRIFFVIVALSLGLCACQNSTIAGKTPTTSTPKEIVEQLRAGQSDGSRAYIRTESSYTFADDGPEGPIVVRLDRKTTPVDGKTPPDVRALRGDTDHLLGHGFIDWHDYIGQVTVSYSDDGFTLDLSKYVICYMFHRYYPSEELSKYPQLQLPEGRKEGNASAAISKDGKSVAIAISGGDGGGVYQIGIKFTDGKYVGTYYPPVMSDTGPHPLRKIAQDTLLHAK